MQCRRGRQARQHIDNDPYNDPKMALVEGHYELTRSAEFAAACSASSVDDLMVFHVKLTTEAEQALDPVRQTARHVWRDSETSR